MEINSIQNAKVKTWMKYHQKKYRDLDGKYLIEGEHLIEEALQAKVVSCLLIRKGQTLMFDFLGSIYYLDDSIIDKLSKNVSQVNYMAVCEKKECKIKEKQRLLLLDAIQDPGNMGTIIRSAYSFGFDAIYLGKDCVDIYNEKVIRSTQGALFYLPLVTCDILSMIKELQKEQVEVIVTALSDESYDLSELQPKGAIAIVMGNEGCGVKQAIIDQADVLVKIEMTNFESLNVAIAASICMYELRKG